MTETQFVKIIECPRDAIQGWKQLIPTKVKIDYYNLLLKVGFDTLDMGSFVSAKVIPQMADTDEVLAGLDRPIHTTRLLTIVANRRGADAASEHPEIGFMGYPFSLSDTFQQQNTGATMAESLERVKDIHHLCKQRDKQLVVYLSMAFGNPYKDPYSAELVREWGQQIAAIGVRVISLADTVGLATPEEVLQITRSLVAALPEVEIGVHLHSQPGAVGEKVAAALQGGARRIDGALGGFGGCPMAGNELIGNLNTTEVVRYLHAHGFSTGVDQEILAEAEEMAMKIFV
jgi:hydroxymethylglutaryl-CoA lyase